MLRGRVSGTDSDLDSCPGPYLGGHYDNLLVVAPGKVLGGLYGQLCGVGVLILVKFYVVHMVIDPDPDSGPGPVPGGHYGQLLGAGEEHDGWRFVDCLHSGLHSIHPSLYISSYTLSARYIGQFMG